VQEDRMAIKRGFRGSFVQAASIFRIVGLIVAGSLFLTQCASINQAALQKDNVSPDWISSNLGPMSVRMTYVNLQPDFNDTIRIYKESVLQDSSISQTDKEKIFENLKPFTFSPNGYVTFFFRLKQPSLIKPSEFKVIFNDKNGESLVERTLTGVNKVTTTFTSKYDTSTDVSYNYYWLMKMKKPFIKANYTDGSYIVRAVYPNGQDQVFEIKPE
jgi:hypothetical protein